MVEVERNIPLQNRPRQLNLSNITWIVGETKLGIGDLNFILSYTKKEESLSLYREDDSSFPILRITLLMLKLSIP